MTGKILHYTVSGDSNVWAKTDGSNPVFDFAIGGHWMGATLQISDHFNAFGRVFNADGHHSPGTRPDTRQSRSVVA